MEIEDFLTPHQQFENGIDALTYRVIRAFDRVRTLAGRDVALPHRIRIDAGDDCTPWFVSFERVLGRVEPVVSYMNNDGRWQQGLLAEHMDAKMAVAFALPELLEAARHARKCMDEDDDVSHLDGAAAAAVADAQQVPADFEKFMAKVPDLISKARAMGEQGLGDRQARRSPGIV